MRFHPQLITCIKGWKNTDWKKSKHGSKMSKFRSLTRLTKILNAWYGKNTTSTFIIDARFFFYSPMANTIVVNKGLSIISLLHEYGHALYGKSEFKACRFSTWLFKATFPKSYAKLVWQGHKLIKPIKANHKIRNSKIKHRHPLRATRQRTLANQSARARRKKS